MPSQPQRPSPGIRESFDATIVTNPSLHQYIRSHRRELLEFYTGLREDFSPLPIGSELPQGLKHTHQAIGIASGENARLDHIIDTLAGCFSEYDFYTPEIFFGPVDRVRPHNDVSMYLRSGQDVVVQFWVLLEACVFEGAAVRDSPHKNALKLWTPAAPGPYYSGTDFALTPEGRQRYEPEATLGGDVLSLGDVLVFKNGVIHFTDGNPGSDVFRVALSMRGILEDRGNDENFLLWMKHLWETDPELASRAGGTYANSAKKMLLDEIGERAVDMSRVTKIDRNDYRSIVSSLASARFGSGAPARASFIPLRTRASLAGLA